MKPTQPYFAKRIVLCSSSQSPAKEGAELILGYFEVGITMPR